MMQIANRPALVLALCLALAACKEFPALDGPGAALPPGTVAPALLPLGPVLAEAGQVTIGPETTASLLARAAALRARAARLRARRVGG
jgi:hypothetical protein